MLVEEHTFLLSCYRAGSCSRLTQRQREVAELAAKGYPNKTIARTLGISPNTVAAHLQDIYRRCRVSSRVELAKQLPPLN